MNKQAKKNFHLRTFIADEKNGRTEWKKFPLFSLFSAEQQENHEMKVHKMSIHKRRKKMCNEKKRKLKWQKQCTTGNLVELWIGVSDDETAQSDN